MSEQGYRRSRGLPDRRHHVPAAGLLGANRARDAFDPRRLGQRHAAAVLVPGPRHPAGDQEPPGHRGLAPAGPQGRRVSQRDGTAASRRHADVGRQGRLRGGFTRGGRGPPPKGQGVFAIALDRVWERRREAAARRRSAAPGSDGPQQEGRERRAARTIPARRATRVRFAHASERQFARLLDFYQIEWEYEPTSFDIELGP